MKILVTGGAGFIASHLVDDLIDQYHEVVVIDNLSTGKKTNINERAIFYHQDIRDNLDTIFRDHKFDCVFHFAAQINLRNSIKNPIEDANTNIIGGLNVLEACKRHGVKKIIFSSTGGAIYSDEQEIPWTENSKCDPQSPYGISKLTLENYIKFYNRIYGLDYTILRFSNVFGERQNYLGEAGVVSIFIDNIINGKPINIFGSGNQERDFIYVNDVCSAATHVLDNNISGTFNVSSGIKISINELLNRLCLITPNEVPINYLPEIPGEMFTSCLSNEKLQATGWSPAFLLDEGLRLTTIYSR